MYIFFKWLYLNHFPYLCDGHSLSLSITVKRFSVLITTGCFPTSIVYIIIQEWSWFSEVWDAICAVCLRMSVTSHFKHWSEAIMSTMASRITSITIAYSTVYSGADQWKHQSSVLLVFVRGIHRWPVNSPRKGPVTRELFPFDDVIMMIFINFPLNGAFAHTIDISIWQTVIFWFWISVNSFPPILCLR